MRGASTGKGQVAPVPHIGDAADHDGVVVQFAPDGFDDFHLKGRHALHVVVGLLLDGGQTFRRPLAGAGASAQLGQQVLKGQLSVGGHAHCGLRVPAHFLRVGVDLHQLLVRLYPPVRRRGQEEPRADHQHHVGLRHRQAARAVTVVVGADAQRMVLAHRALALGGGYDGRVEGLGQFQQFRRKLRFTGAAASPDQRTPGVGQEFRRLPHRLQVGPGLGEDLGFRGLYVGGGGQNVPGYLQLHRTGPSGQQMLHCRMHHRRDFRGAGRAVLPLGQMLENV